MMSNQPSIHQASEAASAGDTQTAITILRDLIKQHPRDVDAWLALAEIVEKPEQAKQCWERVLQIDPDNQIAIQKLLGEQSNEFDFLFETTDEAVDKAVQEPAGSQQDIPALDFSHLYKQPADNDSRQSQPQAIDPPPTPYPNAAMEARPEQQPQQQKPTTKKRVQKKKRRFSAIEIALVILIVIMCLCLCVIGFAAFAKNSVLESLEYSELLLQEPTDLPDDVIAVIYENIRASNAKDFNRYMATIHADSPAYNTTKETIETAFSDEFTLSYKISDVYIVEQGSNKAIVHFTLTTKLVSGSISFRDNQVTGKMTLRREDGSWKIYDQKVDNVAYLD